MTEMMDLGKDVTANIIKVLENVKTKQSSHDEEKNGRHKKEPNGTLRDESAYIKRKFYWVRLRVG